jgi:hypothetical protein
MAYRILLRRDTSTNWSSNNPVLSSGEPGFAIDTNILKIGDGSNPWNDLPELNPPGATGPTGDVAWNEVPQSILPGFSNTYDLGSTDLKWRNLYVAGSLYLNDSSTSLSASNGNVIISGGTGNQLDGDFYITGDSNVSGDLNVTGNLNLIPYKSYSALITQTSGAPVPTLMYSTFSGDLVWDRTSTGQYTLTSDNSEFVEDKTYIVFSQNALLGSDTKPCGYRWNFVSTSVINIESVDYTGITGDGLFYSTSFEIRVYN